MRAPVAQAAAMALLLAFALWMLGSPGEALAQAAPSGAAAKTHADSTGLPPVVSPPRPPSGLAAGAPSDPDSAPPDLDGGSALAAQELLKRLDQMRAEVKSRPKTAEIEFALGNLYYESARWPDAIDFYRQLLTRAAPAIAAYRALRESNPRSPAKGEAQEKESPRSAPLRLAGPEGCGAPEDRISYDRLIAAAERSAEAGQVGEALACYEVALLPLSLACVRMGNAWYLIGNEDKAIEAQARALELQPDDPEALFFLGAILFEGGEDDVPRLKRARELWRHFLRVNTDPDRGRLVSRDLLRLQAGIDNRGKIPRELPPQQQAMAVGPIDPPGPPPELDPTEQAALAAAVKKGNAALEAHRWQQALAAFDEGRNLDPGDPDAARGAGLALFNLGKLLPAEAALRDGLGRKPDDARGLMALADLYAKEEHYAGAARFYQQVLQIDPALAASLGVQKKLEAAQQAQ